MSNEASIVEVLKILSFAFAFRERQCWRGWSVVVWMQTEIETKYVKRSDVVCFPMPYHDARVCFKDSQNFSRTAS